MTIALLILIVLELGLLIVLVAHLVPTPLPVEKADPVEKTKKTHQPISLFLIDRANKAVAERVIHEEAIPEEIVHDGRVYVKTLVDRNGVFYSES